MVPVVFEAFSVSNFWYKINRRQLKWSFVETIEWYIEFLEKGKITDKKIPLSREIKASTEKVIPIDNFKNVLKIVLN